MPNSTALLHPRTALSTFAAPESGTVSIASHTLTESSSQPQSRTAPANQPEAAQPPVLGIVGGGQLARMLALAAAPLGCRINALEQSEQVPVAGLAGTLLTGSSGSIGDLEVLAKISDVITFENEFVDAALVKRLEAAGRVVRPTAETLRLVQDKLLQKQTLAKQRLPLPPFRGVSNTEDVYAAGDDFGWPLVLKQRRNGYDGKGNLTLRAPSEVDHAWRAMVGDRNPLYVEGFCKFRAELATIITRGIHGEVVQYPLVETVQKEHICHIVKAPAVVPAEIAEHALQIAARAVEAVGGIGSTGVEMFLTADNQVLINELAPRVHNSGHYTIEGCVCSQFENHVRAVLGWPLGSAELRAPAAVMVNLISPAAGAGWPRGVEKALAIPGAHLHLYGKINSGVRRKMGHVTALGSTIEEALATAQRAADCIQFEAK